MFATALIFVECVCCLHLYYVWDFSILNQAASLEGGTMHIELDPNDAGCKMKVCIKNKKFETIARKQRAQSFGCLPTRDRNTERNSRLQETTVDSMQSQKKTNP